MTQNATCSSGTFTSTFNITAMPVSSQTISLSANDLAVNNGTASLQFNRINCTAGQTLSVNTCIDTPPTGTVLFAADYTKVLTPNVVNITSANTTHYQMYSDAGCVTTIGTLQPIATSFNATITAGEGTKTIYAKLFNGALQSACLTDSIILDQTAPVITVTNPTEGFTTTSSSLNVAGNCQTGLTVFYKEVGYNEASITCPSGTYSRTLALNATLGAKVIQVRQADQAGNETLISRNMTLNGVPCVAGDAITTSVNLANATGIGGFKPNCTVAACNSGYTANVDNKGCGPSNHTVVGTMPSSHTYKVVAFDSKLFMMASTGSSNILKVMNTGTLVVTDYNLGTGDMAVDMAICNNQLLFITKASGNVSKLKKYNTAAPTVPSEVATMTTLPNSDSFYQFLAYKRESQLYWTIRDKEIFGDGVFDGKRIYLRRVDQPASGEIINI